MRTKIIEAVSRGPEGQPWNHGKFLVGRFDVEHSRDDVAGYRLIGPRWGFPPDGHVLVLDLETGEGALFRPGGLPIADLDKHRVWVCVLFPAFLEWLYGQDLRDLDALPDVLELSGIALQLRGYRRAGATKDLAAELTETFVRAMADGATAGELAAEAVERVEARLRDRLLTDTLPKQRADEATG